MSDPADSILRAPLRLAAGGEDAFSLRGRRLAVAGRFTPGVERVAAGGTELCRGPACVPASGAAVAPDTGTAAPEGIVRTVDGFRETVAVSREAAVAGWWWRAEEDGRLRIRVRPAGEARREADALAWEVDGAAVALRLGGDLALDVVSAADGALLVDVPVRAGQRVQAVLAAADGIAAALRLAADALTSDAPFRGGRAEVRRQAREGLRANAADPRVAQALGWARHRLEGHLAEAAHGRPHGGAAPAAPLALAALGAAAAGDLAAARESAAALLELPPGAGAAAHRILLTARIVAWQGNLGFAASAWPGVARLAGEADAQRPRLLAVALAEAAVLAEALGLGAEADDLRTAAAERGGGRPLIPAALLAPEAGSQSWDAWRAMAASPDGAPEAWLEGVGRPGHGGPGLWPAGPEPDGAAGPAGVVLGFVHGLLGAHPDATRGRLVLRPRLPAAWDRLDVAGLPLGDGAVALRYRREGTRHRFEVEAEAGAVPPQLVLEPALPGARVAAARVDGAEADLEVRHEGDRVVVPVQLPLDDVRVLEVETA